MRLSRLPREYSVLSLFVVIGAACASDGKHAHWNANGDDAGLASDADDTADGGWSADDAGSRAGDDATVDDGGGPDGDEAMVSLCQVCTNCEHDVVLPATANHVNGDISYTDLPPAGGDHNVCWLNFGVYDQEKPDERWVHNLEHGGVVFLYHCPSGCAAEVAALKKLMAGKEQVLLTPYAALPTKFAAVSWGTRLLTNCFDSKQFANFYASHVDHGPESIKVGPSSAYCPP
jgi:hypothetical protein